VRRRATDNNNDDIYSGFDYGHLEYRGSNNLSKNKLRRKAQEDNGDRTGIALCNYKCLICKKFVRKSEFHIHEHEPASKKIVATGKSKCKKTISDDDEVINTRFKPIKITKKIESFNESVNLLRDEINSSEALANNPCLSCSVECFCMEEKRYLSCERIENWLAT